MLKSYIAFDLETTGLNPEQNEIIEIGALKVRHGRCRNVSWNSSAPQRTFLRLFRS